MTCHTSRRKSTQSNMTEQIYTGAIKHVESPLDYKTKEVAFASQPFDWAQGYDIESIIGVIPSKDQGSAGSCGGQAWSYHEAAILAGLNKAPYIEQSAKFVYSQTFVKGGGSDGRTNCDLIVKKGIATEALTPSYINGLPPDESFMERPQDITPEAFADAKTKIALSFSVGVVTIDEVARMARDNFGTIIGIDGSNNGTWRSAFPVPPAAGKAEWSHWLYVGKAKLINGKKYIGVKNSWGDSTGEKGWQWIGEDYFQNYMIWVNWNMIPKIPNPIRDDVFTKPLTYGMQDPDVVMLQQKLQKQGFFPKNVNCTGYFGDITARAVKAWQVANGLMDFANETNLKKIRFGEKSIAKLNKQ